MYIINNVCNHVDRVTCVGCKACGDSCMNNAIIFKEDEEGFTYPVIDEKKCVDCGACLKACPVKEQLPPRTEESRCFSAWSRDDVVRENSTSGGFFYELAKLIIEDNGIVIGAKYTDDYKNVVHSVAFSMDELNELMGSKYVQSDMGGIFKKVLKLLNDKHTVLFAGTPCQCAAMRKYLEGKVCLDNLYLMDFVCYSIYSPLVYKKWLQELEEQEHSPISKVRFKSKKFGWENRYLEIEFENGVKKYQSDLKGEDLYIAGIEDSDLYQRQSCYDCMFREENHRAADFTVGDFWGLKFQTEYDLFKGISFVMSNSLKADKILKKLNKNMVIRRCQLDDIKKGNPNIVENPILQNDKRKAFFSYLNKYKFSEALYKATGFKTPKIKKNHNMFTKVFFDKNVSMVKYLYYNYFCKNVIRNGNAKIIPYKNSIIAFEKNSKLILEGFKDFNIGINKLPGSKAETYLRLAKDAKMTLHHGADLYYGTTVELMENSEFESGYFSMNTGTVIVVDYKMSFGEYVGFGRNNMIYDSDFHAMYTSSGNIINRPRQTTIGNHVWITSNNTILPGSVIGDNVIVSSRNNINFHVHSNSFVRDNKVSSFSGWWSELPNMKEEALALGKKIIIVGFGVDGKNFLSRHGKNVIAIIDNYSKSADVVTFKEFVKKNKTLNQDEVFVICSTKYYDELYSMVRKEYLDSVIISGNKFYD